MSADEGYTVGAWKCSEDWCEAKWWGTAGDGYPHPAVRDLEEHARRFRARAAFLAQLGRDRHEVRP